MLFNLLRILKFRNDPTKSISKLYLVLVFVMFWILTRLICLLYEVYMCEAIISTVVSFCGWSKEFNLSTILISSSQNTGFNLICNSAFWGTELSLAWLPFKKRKRKTLTWSLLQDYVQQYDCHRICIKWKFTGGRR